MIENNKDILNILYSVLTSVPFTIIGILGGVIGVLKPYVDDDFQQQLTLSKFLYEICVAGFVALLVYHLLVGYLNINILAVACGMAGYQANKVLEILNTLVFKFLLNYFKHIIHKNTMLFPNTIKNNTDEVVDKLKDD